MKIYQYIPFCPLCNTYDVYFGIALFECYNCNYDFWFSDENIDEVNLTTMGTLVYNDIVYNEIIMSKALRIIKLKVFQ